MRVLVSGGGTAGHIYPALTVAERLVAEHDEVVFVGTPNGFESRLVPERGVPFEALEASGYDRARPLTLVTSSVRIALSTFRAWRRIGERRPDVVVGFGGYVSIPVGFAAVLRRVPLVLHEQNSVPGLANRVLSRWAHSVGVTYEESAARLAHPSRARVTGNPVREGILAASRTKGREALGLPPDALVLLVFGGSRGARHLNTAVSALRKRLLAIDGAACRARCRSRGVRHRDASRSAQDATGDAERFVVLDYVDDMGSAICAADLVVGRAGATSIAELTVLGAPCILVPYPTPPMTTRPRTHGRWSTAARPFSSATTSSTTNASVTRSSGSCSTPSSVLVWLPHRGPGPA